MGLMDRLMGPKRLTRAEFFAQYEEQEAKDNQEYADAIGSRAVEGDTGLRQIGGEDNLVSDIGDMIDPQAATGAYTEGYSDDDMRFADLAKRLAMAGDTETASDMLKKMQRDPVTGTTDSRDYEKAIADGGFTGSFFDYEMAQKRAANPSGWLSDKPDTTIKDNYMWKTGDKVTDIHTLNELKPFLDRGDILAVNKVDQEKVVGYKNIKKFTTGLEDKLFGEDGIWSDYYDMAEGSPTEHHLMRVAGESWDAALNQLSQEDPRYRAYNAQAEALSGWLYRLATGEVGNLTHSEAQRGLAMIPVFSNIKSINPLATDDPNTYVTDLPPVARLKLKALNEMVDQWSADLLAGRPLSMELMDKAEEDILQLQQELDPEGIRAPKFVPGSQQAPMPADKDWGQVMKERRLKSGSAPTPQAKTSVLDTIDSLTSGKGLTKAYSGGASPEVAPFLQSGMDAISDAFGTMNAPEYSYGKMISQKLMETEEEKLERERLESWPQSGGLGNPR